ncbi:hypothetical protein [Hymenobacter antarcticus]|uniref:Uncharacterized protein n=1 Tax=Hymenobacter antarcticus TaxID=486270 RepID=A0ABP7PQH1_9BACT
MKNASASLVCLLLALVSLSASAQTTRRVNNSGITGPNIYADIQAAIKLQRHCGGSNGCRVPPGSVAGLG